MLTNQTPRATHAATLPRRHRAWHVIGSILLFLIVFSVSLSAMVMADVSSWANRVDVDQLLGNEHQENKLPSDNYADKDLNVLVIGSDHRNSKEYDEQGRLITGMRSDTTLIVHISADRQRVELMSIPRDLMVKRPACTYSDGTTEPASTADIQFNSVFALIGKDDDVASATACTIKTVEDFTGIFIDEFVVVDFDGFENMVAALGGVHMCFDKPVADHAAQLNLPAGCQTLDPTQALAYARARKALGDGSDLSRIGRQQQLLGAMFKDAKSRNLLTNMPSLYAFLKASLKSVTTSESFANAQNLGGLALSLANISPVNIRFYMTPVGEYPADRARVGLTDEAEKMFTAFRSDQPIPESFPYQDLDGNKIEASTRNSTEDSPDTVGDDTLDRHSPTSSTTTSSINRNTQNSSPERRTAQAKEFSVEDGEH